LALPFVIVAFFISICFTLIEKYVCCFDRLLHSDLANLTENLRRANNDLESSRREVENLKHQLQEYVSEVRRVEELLAKKVYEISGAPFMVPL
jgi:predicted  nucleic acid-binding Zn-ribbon protein